MSAHHINQFCGTSKINKLQWAIKVVETLRKLYFSTLQAESTNIRFNEGGFEFVDRFRGNFSPSFGLAKSPGWGDTPLCGLNGDVRPDRVWFSGCFVLNGVSISSLSVLNRVSLHDLMA